MSTYRAICAVCGRTGRTRMDPEQWACRACGGVRAIPASHHSEAHALPPGEWLLKGMTRVFVETPPEPNARELRPCGTEAAYHRHVRHGEKPCGKCRRAHGIHRSKNRQKDIA